MVKRLFLLIVLLPVVAYGQVEDDFSDGDFSNNPSWVGNWEVFTVNNYAQLQLNDVAAGGASLFTSIEVRDTMEWQFWIRQAFSPSANNYARVYLIAENADTANVPDGLFLQFGESGAHDAIRLMHQQSGDTMTLLRGSPGAISSSFQCRVKLILRNDSCYLYTDYAGNYDFLPEGSTIWHPEPGTRHLGVCCKYTISNSKKFFFDDFYAGPLQSNVAPPEVSPYDVVINEIMADPSPPQLLPEHEYLELYNTTPEEIDLNGWTLFIGGSEKLLTGAKIAPEGYLIVGREENENLFSSYGNFYGLESFSLSNSGQEVRLIDNKGRLISWICYRDDWYIDDKKSDGGWSLEQINPLDPCTWKENWLASKSIEGGSPGSLNSVYDNLFLAPEMTRACVKDPERILVDFNQSMHSELTMHPGVFELDRGAGPIEAVLPANPQLSSFILYPSTPLMHGLIYHLSCITELQNCTGAATAITETLKIALPRKARNGDIVINEILFNPFSGGCDYVEVFNRSEDALSLVGMSIGSVRLSPPAPPDTSFARIVEQCMVLLPGEYVLLCDGMDDVERFYNCQETQQYLSMHDFPSFNNESGTVLLIDESGELFDSFSYHEDMHYPLLHAVEGIALERLHPDRPSYDPTNWHSASQHSGFGTPGYRNSQFLETGKGKEPIEISPRVCVPGYDDLNNHIGIHFQLEEAGCLASIMIFNASGQIIRHLVNNELLGTEGSFSWNGIDGSNNKAPAGLYIILVELTDVRGKILRYKKTCVIAPGSN